MIKKWLFANLTVVAVAFVVTNSLFGFTEPRGETVTVPNVTGMKEEAVTADERFDVIAEYRYDESEAGTVLEQDPPEGAKRKRGEAKERCELRIVVSMGPERVRVPDVIGENASVAAARLREAGLRVELIAKDGAKGNAGSVAEVSPAAGTGVKVGDTVRVFVAVSGKEALPAVPNLVGLSRDEAALSLLTKGFAVGNVTSAASNTPAGTVIRQNPPAGSPLPAKTEVAFVVSNGPSEAEE